MISSEGGGFFLHSSQIMIIYDRLRKKNIDG